MRVRVTMRPMLSLPPLKLNPSYDPASGHSTWALGQTPHLDITGLDSLVQQYYADALAPTTRWVYSTAQWRYLQFCRMYNISPFLYTDARVFVAIRRDVSLAGSGTQVNQGISLRRTAPPHHPLRLRPKALQYGGSAVRIARDQTFPGGGGPFFAPGSSDRGSNTKNSETLVGVAGTHI